MNMKISQVTPPPQDDSSCFIDGAIHIGAAMVLRLAAERFKQLPQDPSGRCLVFSDGSLFDSDIVGIGVAGSTTPDDTFHGYDGRLENYTDLTNAQRVQLADHMIARWLQYRAANGGA